MDLDKWLASIKLPDLSLKFKQNKYDWNKIIKYKEPKINKMCNTIGCTPDQTKIIKKSILDINKQSLGEWIIELKLTDYETAFEENEWDDMDMIRDLGPGQAITMCNAVGLGAEATLRVLKNLFPDQKDTTEKKSKQDDEISYKPVQSDSRKNELIESDSRKNKKKAWVSISTVNWQKKVVCKIEFMDEDDCGTGLFARYRNKIGIMTNHHVISDRENCQSIKVIFFFGEKKKGKSKQFEVQLQPDKFFYTDKERDFCFVGCDHKTVMDRKIKPFDLQNYEKK